MTRTFSTHDIRTQESFDYWQNLVCATYSAPTQNQNLTQGPFEGTLAVKSLGARSLITRIRSTPMAYHETDIGSYNDNYFICLSLCPHAILTQSDMCSEQFPGDIVVYDNNQPFSYTFPAGDNQIVLSVPHILFRAHIKQPESVLNRTLPKDSPLGSYLGAMIEQAWLADEQEDLIGDTMMVAILEILRAAFQAVSAELNGHLAQYKSDNLSLVQHYILERLGDHDLSLENISYGVHMSSRTISRLFAKEGLSVMKWVWLQRLKLCHKTLLTGQYTTISEVAYQAGFSNMAHFSKLFRETYGVPPSELRDNS